MAKSTSEKSKTTKTENAKKPAAKTTAAAKKPTDAKAETAKGATTKKADPKKASATPRATKAGGDPAASLAKKCQEAVSKFDKMGDSKYTEIKEKLEWCIGSYNHDKNPTGLVEYGRQAADMLKQARTEKPKQISQKLIDDLEKAVANV